MRITIALDETSILGSIKVPSSVKRFFFNNKIQIFWEGIRVVGNSEEAEVIERRRTPREPKCGSRFKDQKRELNRGGGCRSILNSGIRIKPEQKAQPDNQA